MRGTYDNLHCIAILNVFLSSFHRILLMDINVIVPQDGLVPHVTLISMIVILIHVNMEVVQSVIPKNYFYVHYI